MPELPEVETTRLGVVDHVINQTVLKVCVFQPSLRWQVETVKLIKNLQGFSFFDVTRRGKYILFSNENGTMLCHLGMSGSMRIITNDESRRKHDHVEWQFSNGVIMRFHDPRRFGSVLWTAYDINQHKLICQLGPEPLSDEFNAQYVYKKANKRKQSIKMFIMDSKTVVGVGNIYASEALYLAGINPRRSAGNISIKRYEVLVNAIKTTLASAIKSGGTTLRDFVNSSGEPGYFKQKLFVYGKESSPCTHCQTQITRIKQAQRATYYCKQCQR